MFYTVGEMAKKLQIPPSTLRYYDKEGLLPFVERSRGGIRMFKEEDFEWLQVIACLKKTGMSLTDIKQYIEMAMEGDATIDERLQLILRQKEIIMQQMAELNETLQTLKFKEWYYKTAQAAGTTDVLKNMTIEEFPKEYQETKRRLTGK